MDNNMIMPNGDYTIRIPKRVATIKICGGAMTFYIDDTMQWKRPTNEQIKNLKELFCIEVIPED
jgi:actin-related protein